MNNVRKALAVFRGIRARIFRPGVIRGGLLIVESDVKLMVNRKARIDISGRLGLGTNCYKRNGRSTILRMEPGSSFVSRNSFISYGSDILIFQDACFEMGESFINADARIRVHESIRIGDGCAISHGLVIMDGNAHCIDGRRTKSPVVISDHVWIGTGVTILPGVHIGKGAVVAAGAVVTKDVPEKCLVAGVPAKIVRDGVSWEM